MELPHTVTPRSITPCRQNLLTLDCDFLSNVHFPIDSAEHSKIVIEWYAIQIDCRQYIIIIIAKEVCRNLEVVSAVLLFKLLLLQEIIVTRSL